jgi:hypothetical protein
MKGSVTSDQDSDVTRYRLLSKTRRNCRKMFGLPSISNTPGEAHQIVGNMKASQVYSDTKLVDTNQFSSGRAPKSQVIIRQRTK